MALQITTNINVDFYDNKYVMVNAKQYDDMSRLISVTCYNQGELYNLSAKNHTAYIKYRKADEHWVLNSCTINYKGQVLIELTEQMLAASGICYVDLFIVNKGSAKVNIDTGSIVTIDGSSVLTTKAFYVDVQEAVVDNSLIESVDNYDGLTGLLNRAEAEYKDVIQLSKSWAVGSSNDIRENEDFDNSKYYSQLSKSYASGGTGLRENENVDNSRYYCELSVASAESAGDSEKNAETYMGTSKIYMDNTSGYMKTTELYMNTTNEHMNTTNTYMNNAKNSKDEALASENKALEYAVTSQRYAIGNTGTTGEDTDNSKYYSQLSKSYASGGTGLRENENVESAKYYYEQLQGISNDFSSIFKPMGTIVFSELSSVEKDTGYLYNISEDFITDDTFKGGAGNKFSAGTNVYYTADGYWDCLSGADSPSVLISDISTVDEVMTYLGI